MSDPTPGTPFKASRASLVGLAALFLLLAGLQVVHVLSRAAPAQDARSEALTRLSDPSVERWLLGSSDPASPRPVGTVFHDGERRRLYARGPYLPTLDRGEVYVLWAALASDDGASPRPLAAFGGGDPVLDAVVEDAPPASSVGSVLVSIERERAPARPGRLVAVGRRP